MVTPMTFAVFMEMTIRDRGYRKSSPVREGAVPLTAHAPSPKVARAWRNRYGR